MKSFIEKYKPTKLEQIPQDNINEILNLIKNKENILIFGPTGSCKTSIVYTIAKQFDYEIIELNASDLRTKEQIESIIGSASKQQSLFNKKKILLIDEPTSSLDKNTKIIILNLIQNIRNKTVVVVTHDSDVKQIVDQVIDLNS